MAFVYLSEVLREWMLHLKSTQPYFYDLVRYRALTIKSKDVDNAEKKHHIQKLYDKLILDGIVSRSESGKWDVEEVCNIILRA